MRLRPILIVTAAVLALGGALILGGTGARADEPDGAVGQPGDNWAARAGRAAAALAAAHPGDRAVAYLAEMVERETAALPAARRTALAPQLQQFAAAAEQQLLNGQVNSPQVQQLLRGMAQQLRQTGVAGPTPGPVAVTPPPSEPVHAFGRELVVEAGQTVEDAAAVGGNLTVRGHVLGDAVAVGGNVRLEAGARVDGDVVAVGGQISVDPQAWVAGERTQLGAGAFSRTLPFAEVVQADHHHQGLWWSWMGETVRKVGMGLVLALVSLIIAALAPNRVRNVLTTTRRRPLLSLLSGLLALVVTLMASVVLVVTIIGIPLVPLLMVAVALALVLGLTAVACLIGEAMPGRRRYERSALRCIVVGVSLLTLLSILPLGGFFLWLLVLTGLGSVILSRVGATAPSE